jgi:hypothetical protein
VVLHVSYDFCFIREFEIAAWPIMLSDWQKFQSFLLLVRMLPI